MDEVNYKFTPNSNADFEVSIMPSQEDRRVGLTLTFKSQDSLAIPIDYMAFTTECYYDKDKKYLDIFLKNGQTDLNDLFKSFEFSQVIIENQDHQLKLLSAVTDAKTVIRDFGLDCIGEWTDIKKGKVVRVEISDVFEDDLLINNSDNKIRFYYLMKGMFKEHYQEFTALSSWLRIN